VRGISSCFVSIHTGDFKKRSEYRGAAEEQSIAVDDVFIVTQIYYCTAESA